jgi:glycosyltransferase involved in cell wall biosynthesis
MSVRISGIVHTKNEERNIARALGSLASWCDELIVVDMNSTDATVRIAGSFGARIVSAPDSGHAESAVPLGVSAASGDWIVRLDADEVIPAKLSQRLRHVAESGTVDAVQLPRLNYMFGYPVVAGGWDADLDRHWRFFKRYVTELAQASTNPHLLREPNADRRTRRMPAEPGLCIVHFNYLDWSQFVDKLNRYTTVEALQAAEAGSPPSTRGLVKGMTFELLRRGIRRRSWRDGYRGLSLVWMQMTYRLLVFVKTRQLLDVGSDSAIAHRYDKITAELE